MNINSSRVSELNIQNINIYVSVSDSELINHYIKVEKSKKIVSKFLKNWLMFKDILTFFDLIIEMLRL